MNYRGFRDLHVYQKAYRMAMEIFCESKLFPREEQYALTDQIRRAARSIPANIAEAWKKRKYEKAFISRLVDGAGEAGETEVWLDMAHDCGYLSHDRHTYFLQQCDDIERMLWSMMNQPEKFCH